VALNWTSENFFLAYVDGFGDTIPTPDIIGMASETSQGMNILPLPEPAPNSSFQLEFYGPSVQCSPANDSQNSVFDYYSNSLLTNYGILTEDTITQLTDGVYNLSKIRRIQIPQMLYFSAFAPYSGSRGWLGNLDDPELTGQSGPDQFNNWDMDLPPDFYPANQSTPFKRWQVNPTAPLGGEFGPEPLDWIVPQLWVQTTSSRMVCFLGNASYTINVEYVDGVQSIVESSTTGFELLYMPQITLPYPQPGTPYQYMSVFMAFTSLLSGNVTTMLQQAGGEADYGNYSMEFSDTSSRLLQTGLVACDEFTGSSFNENPIAEGTIYNGIWRGPIPWNNYSTLVGSTNQNFTADLFQDPAWMCRNGSLLTAIEDLANNITISMMSSPNLT
jgi:hypothetical protein